MKIIQFIGAILRSFSTSCIFKCKKQFSSIKFRLKLPESINILDSSCFEAITAESEFHVAVSRPSICPFQSEDTKASKII